MGEEAELGEVATLGGEEAGEETVGGVAGGEEAGGGATGDLAGDTFGAAALRAGAGAGAGEAELINPHTKTMQRNPLNRAILSESRCSLTIGKSCVTEGLWSRSHPQNENKRYSQNEEKDFHKSREKPCHSSCTESISSARRKQKDSISSSKRKQKFSQNEEKEFHKSREKPCQ